LLCCHAEQLPLFAPIERQGHHANEPLGAEFRRLPTREDRLNDVWGEASKIDEPSDVGTADVFLLRNREAHYPRALR